MARKPVLSGGKKDEIIKTATALFFEKGYEATSVRMIMEIVNGEIGMFYHYFRSKEELFDRVVEKFFDDYREKFEDLINEFKTPDDLVDSFLPLYEESMSKFALLRGNMHWTIQYAMSGKTIESMRPAIEKLLSSWNIKSDVPIDILAGQLLYGISATIHSKGFEELDDEKKRYQIRAFLAALKLKEEKDES
ncbi:MAG: TetR/AcrR family transcriptional regulator [Lachnospiraceae bacterium]|jgi:AcrR family transcriptional regulator|nr:TetR/AcrR family transcriptional regulator [Lachnospiraceae bacterium]